MSFESYLLSFNRPENVFKKVLNVYNCLLIYWKKIFPTLPIFSNDFILYKISERLKNITNGNKNYFFDIKLEEEGEIFELKNAIVNTVTESMRANEQWTDPFLQILFE
jgi:hypothetical protein